MGSTLYLCNCEICLFLSSFFTSPLLPLFSPKSSRGVLLMKTVVTGQENKDMRENEEWTSPKYTEHKVLLTVGVTGTFDLHCINSSTRESSGLVFPKYWHLNDISPFYAKSTFSSCNLCVLGSLYGGPDFMWEKSKNSGILLGMCAQREQKLCDFNRVPWWFAAGQ